MDEQHGWETVMHKKSGALSLPREISEQQARTGSVLKETSEQQASIGSVLKETSEQQARIDALKQIGMDMAVGRWPPDPARVYSGVELHWIRTGAKKVMAGMQGDRYKHTQARFQRIYEQLK